jgi:hypothetical protein
MTLFTRAIGEEEDHPEAGHPVEDHLSDPAHPVLLQHEGF